MSRSIGLVMLLLATGSARARDANAWLGEAETPRDRLTAELNAIAGLAPEEAETEAKRLELLRDNLRGEDRSAAALLEAVAWERAGSASKAKELLELIVGQAEGTPFARSADV